jgi:aspartate aminotransferase
MRRAYEERRNAFVQGLRKVKGLRTLVPQGAFYVFADVSELLNGGSIYDLISEWLEVGVAVAPGMAFGSEYASWVRFSTASSLEELVTAARSLQRRYITSS